MGYVRREPLFTWNGVTLILGLLITFVSGTLYNYTTYAPTLQSQMGYSQTVINMIITVGDIGLYCGFTMGFFYDKMGYRITGIVSSVLIGIGYCIAALITSGVLPPSLFLLSTSYFIIGQGSYGLVTTALDVNFKNYDHKTRGKVSGLLMGGLGLSSGLFTFLYGWLFAHSEVVYYLAFLGGVCLVIGVFGSLNMSKDDSNEMQLRAIPTEETLLLYDEPEYKLLDSAAVTPSLTPMEVLFKADFWMLWMTFLCTAGPGLMVMNNIGDVHLSFGGKEGDKFLSILIGLLSLSSFLGRLVFGAISDRFQEGTPRSAWLIACCCIMGVAHVIFARFPTAATGLAVGGVFSVVPTLVAFFFGPKHFGANFGLCFAAPAAGILLFGLTASKSYEGAIAPPHTKCLGETCFQVAFLFTSASLLLGTVVSTILTYRKYVHMFTTPTKLH